MLYSDGHSNGRRNAKPNSIYFMSDLAYKTAGVINSLTLPTGVVNRSRSRRRPIDDPVKEPKGRELGERFSSVVDPSADPHINGEYLIKNPTWHVEYSEWKAQHIHGLLKRKNLHPRIVGEVGCGAGEVLRQLQLRLQPDCAFYGYDVAPPAIQLAQARANERLHFKLADFGVTESPRFDLLLVLEVVDHVEDCFGFLRMLKGRGDWKIFSFSLDISAQNALRRGALLRRRLDHSHLHHFSKETALAALEYSGYEVLDSFYPPGLAITPMAKLGKPLRRILSAFGQDFAVRLLGGCSLMVLAR